MPGDIVILDNTVLTNFALVNRPDLLFELWGDSCATTPAVMAEYQAGVTAGKLPANIWQALIQFEPAPLVFVFASHRPAISRRQTP